MQQMQQHYTAGDERYRMLDILKRLHEADAAELAEIEAREVESEDDTEDTTQLELSNELMQKLSVMVSLTCRTKSSVFNPAHLTMICSITTNVASMLDL